MKGYRTMAKEKIITRAMECTKAEVNTIRVWKQPDETGTIKPPEMGHEVYELQGNIPDNQVLEVTRKRYEQHWKTYDLIVVGVLSVHHCWQLKAKAVSEYFYTSETIAEADTFEGLRAKQVSQESGEGDVNND